jgi:hypothetical protein
LTATKVRLPFAPAFLALISEEGRLAYLELITRDERLQGSAPIRRKDGQNLMIDYVVVPTHVHEHPFYMALMWRSDNETG